MQVVVQQPADRGVRFRYSVSGEGAGVLAEQVVQLVAAGRRLADQMLVIEFTQKTRC